MGNFTNGRIIGSSVPKGAKPRPALADHAMAPVVRSPASLAGREGRIPATPHGWIRAEVLEEQGQRRRKLGGRGAQVFAAGPGNGEATDIEPPQRQEDDQRRAERRPPPTGAEAGRGEEHRRQHRQGVPLEKMAFVAPVEGRAGGEGGE